MAAIISSSVQTYLKEIEGSPLHRFIEANVRLHGYNLADITEMLIKPEEPLQCLDMYTITFRNKESIVFCIHRNILDKAQHL